MNALRGYNFDGPIGSGVGPTSFPEPIYLSTYQAYSQAVPLPSLTNGVSKVNTALIVDSYPVSDSDFQGKQP